MELREKKKKSPVVIVENDSVICTLYSAILIDYSPQACTFEGAFEAVSDFVPHLIIIHLDSDLYVGTLEFLRKVRQTYGAECPSVLLIVPKDWLDSPLDAFIEKRMTAPVDPDELRSDVENLLRKKLF